MLPSAQKYILTYHIKMAATNFSHWSDWIWERVAASESDRVMFKVTVYGVMFKVTLYGVMFKVTVYNLSIK